ncbi:uncharacterized protein BXZ73DRAFT_90016 [Epithele typhae]|uniref:uncharacterized protein n=1 Tax=Epithele typhae TaxID=378194 RepID=UPI0020077C2B|nr:uncharacterized protein BXZ73DRAFT_90016 [Epithele typhae]KAH9932080.1 hypothetical protein BXZ73DRAFT_90016 [Epithele typhae]
MGNGTGWEDHLHWGLLSEHVLVAGLKLDSGWSFFVASLLTIAVCVSERILTYAISQKWNPFLPRGHRPTRLSKALWQAMLYWLVTLARLMYMLIGMTFSFGLIIIAVTTLATGQFIIELLDHTPLPPRSRDDSEHFYKEPLLHSDEDAFGPEPSPVYPPSRPSLGPSPPGGRPRSKSKPDAIFIHPNESNLARADVAAAQLGLGGDTERVRTEVFRVSADTEAWEPGRGRDVARELLGR